MKGYKAFNKDLQCRDMQYKIGETYELGDTPICCQRGFHFCKSISDCYNFYDMTDETRICEVEALGKIVTDDGIEYCTDKIHIIREVENPGVKTNVNETSTGYCNSGNYNAGDLNSGGRNSGNYNSGYINGGSYNTGDRNSGSWNSGSRNTGNWNSGNHNAGNYNSGHCNSGIYNSGDFNSGNHNSGVFNTEKIPTIKMFDKDSNWTINDWCRSTAYSIMEKCPMTYADFIRESNMSKEEKINHPEYKIMGGYTKIITVKAEDKQKWWDDLSDNEKQAVMSLPNFDTDKFYQCTEIRVEKTESDVDISESIYKRGKNNKVPIPYLMHKEMGIPISDCQKAYDVAIEYLRSQAKVKG